MEKIEWFTYIKENFDNLISDSSLIFSEMDQINKLFIEQVKRESDSFNICLYLSLRKIKNER